jgi:DtxR family Mn-dependent transcriptional regulator
MLSGKRRPSGALTASHEHYLRAIWDARARAGYARVTDVAHALGISHATLSIGLRPLEERGLLSHDSHRFLVLSAAGERIAREVHHRHSVLHRFLTLLGVDGETAEREACLMEHDVGAETTERLVDLLRLLHEDPSLGAAFRARLSQYHRSCATSGECATCGLACLPT